MLYVLGLITMCLAWQMPGHYFPWAGFQQDTAAAVGAELAALAVVVTASKWPVRVPALALTAVLLALVPMLQWSIGFVPYLSDALVPAAYLVAFGATIITGLQLARSSSRFVGALFATFGVGAFVSAGLGLAQWGGLGPYGFLEALGHDNRVFANFTQPNHLASLLALGAVALLWAYERRRIGGFVASFALGFLAWGLVMTQSRVAWLSVLLFVALSLAYRRRLALRTTAMATVGASGIFVAMVLAWVPLNARLQSGVGTATLAERMQSGYRLIHWETLWDALLRSPWVGYGWMQVPSAQQAAVLDHPPTFEQLGSSHNQFLDLLLWNGLPLGLLVIGVIVWWAVSRMRRCADVDSWAFIAGLGVLFAHSMVEFPLQYAYFLLPAALMIGAIEARQPQPDAFVRLSIGRGTYASVALALAVLLGFIATEYFDLEEQVRRVRLREVGVIERPGWEARVPDVPLLDAQREYVRMWLLVQHEGMTPTELDWLRTVTRRFPTPPALTRYAFAAGLNGRADEASRALKILCYEHLPRHCDDARKRWEKAVEQHPTLAAIPFPPTPSH
jgi:O-antigen ligase